MVKKYALYRTEQNTSAEIGSVALFKEGCGNVEVDVQVEVDSAKNEKTITKTIKKICRIHQINLMSS